MENPATWGEAEKIVHAALRNADAARQRGVIGLSRARQVTDALRKAGLLARGSMLEAVAGEIMYDAQSAGMPDSRLDWFREQVGSHLSQILDTACSGSS